MTWYIPMGRTSTVTKEQRRFIKDLEEMGLVVKPTKKHFKVYTADDRWVMDFASSPSDQNWRQSAERQLVGRLQALYTDDGG